MTSTCSIFVNKNMSVLEQFYIINFMLSWLLPIKNYTRQQQIHGKVIKIATNNNYGRIYLSFTSCSDKYACSKVYKLSDSKSFPVLIINILSTYSNNRNYAIIRNLDKNTQYIMYTQTYSQL